MKSIVMVFILTWSLSMKTMAADFTEQTAALSDLITFHQDKQTYLAVKSDALNFLAGEEALFFWKRLLMI